MASKIIKFTYYGEPISKSNSVQTRWSRKLKRCEIFIPAKYEEYESALKQAASDYMKKANKTPFTKGPVKITLIYYMQSHKKKDLLNLPKTTCDALNEVFYTDDCQIVEANLERKYDPENPRVEITISRPLTWVKKLKDAIWSFPPSLK